MEVRPHAGAARRVPVAVDADLQIQDPWGRTMAITVHDGRGTIVVPRSALRYSSLRDLPRDRARWVAELQRLLGVAGLAIEVSCEGRTIARLAAAGGGNWLAWVLRLGPVDILLSGIVAALVLGRPR
jgi:hypothetical protein